MSRNEQNHSTAFIDASLWNYSCNEYKITEAPFSQISLMVFNTHWSNHFPSITAAQNQLEKGIFFLITFAS